MEASEEDDFYCPLCGCNLLWMPVSRIFVCEHCKESFSESAKYYLRKKEDVTEGNQQKMREALVFLRDQELWMLEGNVRHCVGLTVFGLEQVCKIMRGVIEEALSKPPRNCDVGTPEEQTQRMHAQLCSKQKSCYELPSGEHCPMYREGIDCRLAWAQMPYKA